MLKSVFRFIEEKMFHPAQWFVEDDSKIDPKVLDPPSWRERQVHNKMIDNQYEESLQVEEENQEPPWAEKYK